MNISFEGSIVSNSLPSNQVAGSSVKRGRNPTGSNGRRNTKRVRRDGLLRSQSPSTIPSTNSTSGGSMMMGDDSFSSNTSLDDLAESLRECTQRLDYSSRLSGVMDFSSNSHVGMSNMSMRDTSMLGMSDRSYGGIGGGPMGLSAGGRAAANVSIANTSPFGMGGINDDNDINYNHTVPTSLLPPRSRSNPTPAVRNFVRIRRESPDRL